MEYTESLYSPLIKINLSPNMADVAPNVSIGKDVCDRVKLDAWQKLYQVRINDKVKRMTDILVAGFFHCKLKAMSSVNETSIQFQPTTQTTFSATTPNLVMYPFNNTDFTSFADDISAQGTSWEFCVFGILIMVICSAIVCWPYAWKIIQKYSHQKQAQDHIDYIEL